MAVNKPAVVIRGGGTDVGLGVGFKPCVDPFLNGTSIRTGQIQRLSLLDRNLEFLFNLCLSFTQDILGDTFACVGIISRRVAALPAAILPFPDITSPFALRFAISTHPLSYCFLWRRF